MYNGRPSYSRDQTITRDAAARNRTTMVRSRIIVRMHSLGRCRVSVAHPLLALGVDMVPAAGTPTESSVTVSRIHATTVRVSPLPGWREPGVVGDAGAIRRRPTRVGIVPGDGGYSLMQCCISARSGFAARQAQLTPTVRRLTSEDALHRINSARLSQPARSMVMADRGDQPSDDGGGRSVDRPTASPSRARSRAPSGAGSHRGSAPRRPACRRAS